MSRRLFAAILVLLAVVVGGCGLSADESPRLIDAQDLPPELRLGQIPTPVPQPDTAEALGSNQVHMVQNNRLVTVERAIADSPDQLMELLLLRTFPAEAASNISTAIPRGTSVQSTTVDRSLDLVVVDLAPGSLDSRRSEQQLAFAQIVYTLTSLPDIEVVQFVQSDPLNPNAEAVPLAVQTDSRTTLQGERVGRVDFAAFAPARTTIVFDPEIEVDIAAAPAQFKVWMLDERNRLESLERASDTTQTSETEVLESLLGGIRLDEGNRFNAAGTPTIRSAIPPDALLNEISVTEAAVSLDDGTTKITNIARVDLFPASVPNERAELYFAAAQIVFTLTELPDVDEVVIFVNGDAFPVPTDTGTFLPFEGQGLQRSDFLGALNGEVPPEPPPEDLETEANDIEGEPGAEGETSTDPAAEPTPG